ncbi:TlpA family protein disulfide reductase [Nocardioides sp.]|uniref:TlpA family protein disulfide reductase n=1 Tax=Nocardioides sp. TaxID=35761 RepID=UPI00351251BF
MTPASSRRPGRSRRAVVAALALAVVLPLAACGDGAGTAGGTSVDVDTPELRDLRAAAGIEPCAPGTATEPASGGLPSLTLPCLGGGESVDLAGLRGPLVINLWASNCGPCRSEMPVLQEFHTTYGDRVPVLGIDMQDTYPEAAIGLAQLTGATYPSLADPDGELFGISEFRIPPALPQFILLDADGAVAHQQLGGFDTLAEVEDMVAQHLPGVLPDKRPGADADVAKEPS